MFQGSILCINVYINDIANVSAKLKFVLFADDTNILYSKEVKDVENTVLYTSINLSKNYLMFSNKKRNFIHRFYIF